VQPFHDLEDDEQGPKEPYYWEEDGDENAPARTKLWHAVHYVGSQVFNGMEFMGEVFADFFGLNQSKFQWAQDAMERDPDLKRQIEPERAQIARERLERAQASARGLDSAATPGAREEVHDAQSTGHGGGDEEGAPDVPDV
jgi:hypothetical protein